MTATETPTTPMNPVTITNKLELTENFYICTKKKQNVKIQVKLTGEGVYLRRETDQMDHINEQLLRMDDIIGSRCGPRIKKRPRGVLSSCKRVIEDEPTPVPAAPGEKVEDTSAYLYIYAYLKQDKPLRRNRTVRILRFRSSDDADENMAMAERWHEGILYNKGRLMNGKQLLILLNPKSGSGRGRALFQREVAPVLKETEILYELHVTTHANFARDLVRKRKDLLQRYSGIVVASGDGLFFEVLNGIMERPDWQSVCRELPLGIIPCGSGNGLAKSIAHLYNEPYEPKPILYATLNCVSGKSQLMDIVRVETGSEEKKTVMYSFLSVGWGLIADIDIESERLRSIGASRFTLWSVHRLINLRTYKGKLWYLPWRKDLSNNVHDPVGVVQPQNGSVLNSYKENTSYNNFDDEDFADVISLDDNSSRAAMDSWHSATSRRTAYYSIAGHSMRSQRSLAPSMSSRIDAANASYQVQGPVSKLPPIDEWVYEEGEYVMIHSGYTTHLSTDCFFVPQSRLNDGIIYLVIIRTGVSRNQLMQFLLNLNAGTHLTGTPNEYIELVAVRAFRIEPDGTEGIITVDGERVDYGPIQCEIFPGMFNVMVPNVQQK